MRLKITNITVPNNLDVYCMSLEEFGRKESHPFVATTKWERIEVDLCEETPLGFLGQIHKDCPIVPVIRGAMTPKVQQLLCELYPDERAALRQAYMRGSEKYAEFVEELSKKYSWKELTSE